LAHCITLMKN